MIGRLMLRVLIVVLLTLLPLVAGIDTVPARTPAIPARIEFPLRGAGPLTGYAYIFLTRPHFSMRTSTCARSSRQATPCRN